MSLQKKFSYGYIHKHKDICFQHTPRMKILRVKKWCSVNVFSKSNRNIFAGNFAQSEKFLVALREHIIFNFN